MHYEELVERETDQLIRIVWSCSGSYLPDNDLGSHFAAYSIEHQLNTSSSPHQNDCTERNNGKLLNLVRAMLHHKNVPK